MDALNYENRTSFSHDDFIFGTPEPFELIPGESLTRILFTLKVGRHTTMVGIFTTTVWILDLSMLVGSLSWICTLLSELIPLINEFYGIAFDRWLRWSQLPVFDPQTLQPLVVAL